MASSRVFFLDWWSPQEQSRSGYRYVLRLAFVFALYFGAGKLGLAVPFTSSNVSPIWPAAGVAVAAVLIWGIQIAPAIAFAAFLVNVLVREAFFGNVGAAKQRAMDALALSKSRDVQYAAAFALALSGDYSRSQTLTDDLAKRFPEDTTVGFTYMPTLRALLALKHGEPLNAIELLQTAIPYELGLVGNLYPAYVRGKAYLVARQGREAAAEFQKILDHRGSVLSDPIGALANLQIRRAYEMAGEPAKAKAADKEFLTLWKDADPTSPS
jgi:tetratricopeptide (TPR) repeat protein